MKRFIDKISGFFGGQGTQQPVLSPGEFTREYAAALEATGAHASVEIIGDLELRETFSGEPPVTRFLNNAYDVYTRNPQFKDDIIKKFVTAGIESASACRSVVDKTRIVPVIKDRKWMTETLQALAARGAEAPEQVYDDFCQELVIMYAEDSPTSMRYLRPEDLEDAGIAREELRVLACANLRRLLPKIERMGTNGLYLFAAGGDYEASLLLFDTIWAGMQAEVDGEVVVAIPTRDILIATGTGNPDLLEQVRRAAFEAWSSGAYRLTPTLFVYRNGTFSEFD